MPPLFSATCVRRPRLSPSHLYSAYVPPPGTKTGTGTHSLRLRSRHSDETDEQLNETHPKSRPTIQHFRHQLASIVPENLRRPIAAVIAKGTDTARAISHSNAVKYLIAGAIAGIISRTAVSPLEVVATVNMCSTGATRPLFVELRQLFANEGMRGFFKGNAANCLKVAPTKGIQFVAFEALKRVMFRLRDQRDPKANTPLSAWERFLAGGFAGMTAATLCYPLDVAKTLLTAHPEKYSGVVRTMGTVVRDQGPRGLYSGLSPTLVAMMPYAGLDFAIYEQLKLFYLKRKKREANLVVLLFIGAFAGTVAQTACHPLDVLRKRLQLQGMGGRPVLYKNMMDAAIKIVRKEGPGALYKGLQPMYVSAIPSAGMSYVVYEYAKKLLGVRSFQ